MNFQELDSQMLQLLQYGQNQVDGFYIEEFQTMSRQQENQYIMELVDRSDKLLDSLISDPITDTSSDKWKRVKFSYKKNIKGLSLIEQYLKHQFAYTINKGQKVRLCLCDQNGELNKDLNMYVLIHELTHIYDSRYLTSPEKHDKYFWILFSKMIKRAILIGVLDETIFSSDKRRCGTDILKSTDLSQINEFSMKQLPKVN